MIANQSMKWDSYPQYPIYPIGIRDLRLTFFFELQTFNLKLLNSKIQYVKCLTEETNPDRLVTHSTICHR